MIRKILFTFYILFTITLFTTVTAQTKTYKIACLNDYYPYSAVNADNELEGILIDWWNLWAKEAGVEVAFVPTDVQGCIDKIINNEVDIIAGLFFTEERAKLLDYSDYIMRMRSVLYVEKGLKANTINELTCEIGVVKNDLAHIFLKENHPQLKIIVFDSYSALRYAAKKENLKAFVYDLPNPIAGLKNYKDPNGYYEY